jgi:uncharacterized protein
MYINKDRNKYLLIEKLGLLINQEVERDFKYLIPNDLTAKEERQIIRQLERVPSNQEIDEYLSNVSNLVFTVTENCNLRCKYCIYSGNYIGERTHSSNRLSFKIAKRALQLFFKYIDSLKRRLTLNRLNIGFYGGEPLLEMKMIKDIVEYARDSASSLGLDRKFSLSFIISTNGLLLDDTIVNFLVEKDFRVSVSIDGPQEIHDKFRVKPDNQGSWEIVISNLQGFRHRFPNYYKDKVNFLCTVHPLSRGTVIDDFFLSNEDLFNIKKIRFSNVDMNSLNNGVYKFIKAEENKYSSSFLQFEKLVLENFGNEKFKINKLHPGVKLTGTCFPGGRKFFIGVNGSIHICEGISPNFSIGNVFDGINYDEVRRILKQYNEGIIKKQCWKCEVWFLCDTCFAPSANGMDIDLICPKQNLISRLTDIVKYKEYDYEKKFADYSIDTVDDYLEFLW